MLRRSMRSKRRHSGISPKPEPQKRLRLVIDRSSIQDERTLGILLEFAEHPLVEVFSTSSSDGVPYLEVDEANRTPDVLPIHKIVGGKPVGSSGVFHPGQYERLADQETLLESARPVARRSFMFAGYSREREIDAYVTECASLLGTSLDFLLQSNPVTPKEALALLGLFLRVNKDFTLFTRPSSTRPALSVDSGYFYWGLARALLPASWRWFSACVANSHATGNEQVQSLAEAVLKRVDRALHSRDLMWEQCHLPADNNTSDEMLFCFDRILWLFMGAFDALARVANHTHQPVTAKGKTFRDRAVSWFGDDWMTGLEAKNPALGSAMQEGTESRDALELIAPLRNLIHGAGLGAVLMVGRHANNLLVVPPEEKANLQDVANRRGGLAKWGLQDHGSDMLLDPCAYVEALVPAATRALNQLMELTHVENLPGVDCARITRDLPADEWVLGPEGCARLLLLGGLG